MLNIKKKKNLGLGIAVIVIIAISTYYVKLLTSLPESSVFKGMAIGFFTVVLPNLLPIFIGTIAFSYITNYLDKPRNDSLTLDASYGINSSCNLTTTDKQNQTNEVYELEIAKLGLDEQQKNELLDLLKQKLTNITNTALIAEIKEQAITAFQKDTFYQDITNIYQQSHDRLNSGIEALGQRGIINLGVGVGTTLAGLVFLVMSLPSNGEPPQELLPFLTHYLPRLTLALFIELFAYFFLRIYKTGLEEIKYFQNELTNLESKHIALITAFKQNDTTTINTVITSLAETERNRILNKSQTTIELEVARIEKRSSVDTGKLLTDLVSNFSPKKSE